MSTLLLRLMFQLFILVLAYAYKKMPPGFTSCHLSDPDIEACVLKRGREVLPLIFKGIPAYNVPVVDPFHIKELRVDNTGNSRQVAINLSLFDLNVHGLTSTDFHKARVDLKKELIVADFWVPKLTMLGRYTVDGRVLIVPISGNGPINITLDGVNGRYSYTIPRRLGKDGLEYLDVKDTSLDFNTTRVYFNLENLFNGDKALGRQMNIFMNENWREMVADLGPPIAEGLNVAITSILTGLARIVPFQEIFPA